MNRKPTTTSRHLASSPLLGQLREVLEWALDIATKLARGDDEDLRAIENVREFAHGWLHGQRAEIPVTDLLAAIAILFGAIDLDLDLESVSLIAPLPTMTETPSVLPALLRCPGAAHKSAPATVTRRFPGRRNSNTRLVQLAA